jgi:hypothetical protein
MKKILFAALTAFLFFGSSAISYAIDGNTQDNYLIPAQESFYFQRENHNFWISSEAFFPFLDSVDGDLMTKSLFLKPNPVCQSCSVSTKVNGNELSCSVSCKDGQTPVCLPAEFGVRASPKCYCK